MKRDRIQEEKKGARKKLLLVLFSFTDFGFPSNPSSHFQFSLDIDEYTFMCTSISLDCFKTL